MQFYETSYEIGSSHNRQRSFFMDPTTSTNSQYIFDDVYKNEQEKKKYSNNKKYTYFNSLIKMKNKLNPSTDLYSKVFQSPKVG